MKEQNAARALMLAESFGVLSTISLELGGYPFGSVTPYCVDRMCRPIIYISPIAEHTRNIVADSRVSLTIVEKGISDDVQSRGRVTVIAQANKVDADRDIAERYFRYFPASKQYDRTHTFEFFRLEPVRIRFIGGFGQIFWMQAQELAIPNPFSASEEVRIVHHMNQDHADVLRRVAGDPSAQMVGLDSEGFDVLANDRKIRIPFSTPVMNMDQARRAFVDISRRS
jgi:heme iron utilization protein